MYSMVNRRSSPEGTNYLQRYWNFFIRLRILLFWRQTMSSNDAAIRRGKELVHCFFPPFIASLPLYIERQKVFGETEKMLALDNKSRKRSSRNASSLSGLDDNRKKARRDDQPVPVICLTGLTPEEKGKYHQIIEKLGGR